MILKILLLFLTFSSCYSYIHKNKLSLSSHIFNTLYSKPVSDLLLEKGKRSCNQHLFFMKFNIDCTILPNKR